MSAVASDPTEVVTAAYGAWVKPDATLDEMRAGMDHMTPEQAADVVRTEANVGGVPGAWFEAPGAGARTVLHLHGGGLVLGSTRSHADLAGRISRAAGARVFVPDYRLAPEHTYPAALDDAAAVYRALLGDDGVSASTLVVSGDSSGGGLALALMLRARDEGLPLPAAVVLLSPVLDLTCSGETMQTHRELDPVVSVEMLTQFGQLYLNGQDPQDASVSPLFGDLANLPPILVQVGSRETVLSDSIRLSNRVLDAGGSIDLQIGYGLFHVYQQFAGDLPEAAAACERIGAFVDRVTRPAG